jgi:2-C-methyl-D-erythritol 2,4-cyclodiphosphate synthase
VADPGDLPRIGLGFDVHPRAADRPCVLGGVPFDDAPGVGGHSDGDVLCHAIADALLGAAALGDLGAHFPDSDPSIAGIAGTDVLARVVALVRTRDLHPISCDATVIADVPAVAPRRDEIRASVANVLGLDPGVVSIKATRPEGLGLSGDGIGCLAIVATVPGTT